MSDIGPHLAMVMFMGAARADSSPDQLARLRGEVLPMMHDKSTPYCDIIARVRDIMPAGWRLTGEWSASIDRLGLAGDDVTVPFG